MNPLEDKRLRYYIGANNPPSREPGTVVEAGYDASGKWDIKYCNLFDEKNTGRFGPYLHTSDTADEYEEGQIDPAGVGWRRNLQMQFARAKGNCPFVELDNPDAYHINDVLGAIEYADSFGLKVIAKNPLLVERSTLYVRHANVFGAIVEKGAGTCDAMHALRVAAGKPTLPVWFVAYGSGLPWAKLRARVIKETGYINMSVSYSTRGEYVTSVDVHA